MVINFNACSLIHRDIQDLALCVIIPLMTENTEGGDLCLGEAGLRLEVTTGDMVVFPSNHISHFNLHYKGKRGSLVFNSDRHASSWMQNRNGWIDNEFMHAI